METVKDGSPVGLGDQQARPEPSSLESLPLAPISMLCDNAREDVRKLGREFKRRNPTIRSDPPHVLVIVRKGKIGHES